MLQLSQLLNLTVVFSSKPNSDTPNDIDTLSSVGKTGGGGLPRQTGDDIELEELGGHGEATRNEDRATRRAQKRERKLQQLLSSDDMKFSHSIQFNAVPDWSSHYISYSNLKKL